MADYRLVLKTLLALCATLAVFTSAACSSDSEAAGETSGGQSSAKKSACSLSIKVDGDVSFEASDISYSLNVGSKNDQAWITILGNEIVGRDHPFTFWLGFPQAADVGTLPLYEEGQGLISLTLIGGGDYGPFGTVDQGRDPGILTIETLDSEWVEASGRAELTDTDGGRVTVELELAAALPPAKCAK